MAVFKLYYGGDARHTGYRHSRIADSTPDTEVRYAGHLSKRHFVLPWEYDGGSEEWRTFHEMEGKFATGDVVHTHLLSADSRVDALVIHVKKAAGATDDAGKITTPAKVKFDLYDGNVLVKSSGEITFDKPGRHIVEFAAPNTVSIDDKTDTNDDGVRDEKDDLLHAATHRGTYLGENGTIRMTILDASGFSAACLTAFVEVVDFLCVRDCSCVPVECDSDYPEPQCVK